METYKDRAERAKIEGKRKSLKIETVVLPNEGDTLIGKYVQRKMIPTDTPSKESPLYIFETDDGLKGLLTHDYVQRILDEQDAIGKVYEITRGKKIIPEKGNPYVEYDVYII